MPDLLVWACIAGYLIVGVFTGAVFEAMLDLSGEGHIVFMLGVAWPLTIFVFVAGGGLILLTAILISMGNAIGRALRGAL